MEPNYVLEFNESIYRPAERGWKAARQVIGVCICAIGIPIALLFIAPTIYSSRFSALVIGIPLGLLIIVLFDKKEKWEPSPIELRFYPDRLVVYREKVFYEKEYFRESYDVYYADVVRFILDDYRQCLLILSNSHLVRYKYNKNWTLPREPCVDTVCYENLKIHLRHTGDLDLVKEIEQHSPIRVDYASS